MEGLHGHIPTMNWESKDLVNTWKTFYTHVEFMFKGPLKEKEDEEKCAYLMIWVGEHGREVYGTWDVSEDDRKKPDALRAKFANYVEPKSNTVFNRYKFQCRIQQQDEPCDQFITDLRVLAADCGYGGEKDMMIRDRIVFGITSKKVREKLINEGSDLTLVKATEICRTFEMSQKQLKTMNVGEDPNVHVVKKVSQKKPMHKATNYVKTGQTVKPKPMNVCTRCGRVHGKLCPAKGKKCNKCGKMDHFAVACKTRQQKRYQVHEVETEEEYDFDALFVGSLFTNKKSKQRKSDLFEETLKVSDIEMQFQLDTGAKRNVLAIKDYRKLKRQGPMKKANIALRSYSGHKIVPEGVVTLDLQCRNKLYSVEFYVVETQSISIISGQTAEEIGLIKRLFQIEAEYSNLSEGLGCIPGEHTITLNNDAE